MMCQVTIGGVQVIDHKADMMPATWQAVRKRRFLRPENEQSCVAGCKHRLMAIIPHNPHAKHLAKKCPGILEIRYGDSEMVKTEICPTGLICACHYIFEWHGLDMKRLRFEVRHAFPDEHIWEHFIACGRFDTNTMPDQ